VALLASVRQRRRQLALLKALGLTRRQVRGVIAWQASTILVVAAAVGVPLGVVPVIVVPVLSLLAGFIGLLAAGNLVTAVAASVAARTRPASALRAE
jgi:ABC-type antimicrobial peptide transport system permease subunit